MNKKDKFIQKSIEIHGNKYDYSNIEYKDNKTKIVIYCKNCNIIFEQIPYHHSVGKGCPNCSKNKKLSTQEFIIKARNKHGEKFDYSLIDYKNIHTFVKIICPVHGIFEQSPMTHLKWGCKHCAKTKKSNTEEFIYKAKQIHGEKYNYDLVDYVYSNKKVKIICKEHNYIFEQRPSNHLSKKHGCPLCGNRKRRLSRIEEIRINKFNGNQVIPSFNKSACQLFDEISLKENIHIQHAMNGGEYYIKELGYWLDGYDKENNVSYEFDESQHFDKNGNLSEKDIKQEIEHFLKCKFIRISN